MEYELLLSSTLFGILSVMQKKKKKIFLSTFPILQGKYFSILFGYKSGLFTVYIIFSLDWFLLWREMRGERKHRYSGI